MSGGRLQATLSATLCVAFVGIAVGAHHGATATQRSDESAEAVPLEYLPSRTAALGVSLGHRPALADWFWVRGALYFAGEIEGRNRFEWLSEYLDLVIALDPQFVDIYRWGGTALILRTKTITLSDVLLANDILEQGADRFPDNWRLPHMAAANCSYYITTPNPKDAHVLAACRKKYLNMAAWRPGAPFYIALTLSALEQGDNERFCNLLVDAYFSHSTDPVMTQQIERRMTGGWCAGAMNANTLGDYQKSFDRVRARTYPYLEPDLLVHVTNMAEHEPAQASKP
jgi:hypothetical protein